MSSQNEYAALISKTFQNKKNTLLRNSPPLKDDQKKSEPDEALRRPQRHFKRCKWCKFVAGSVAKTERVIICNTLLLWLSEVLWL